MLEDLGISVEFSHHEGGPGQNEIDLRYADAVAPNRAAMVHLETRCAPCCSRHVQHKLGHHQVHQQLRFGALDDINRQPGKLSVSRPKVAPHMRQGDPRSIARRGPIGTEQLKQFLAQSRYNHGQHAPVGD